MLKVPEIIGSVVWGDLGGGRILFILTIALLKNKIVVMILTYIDVLVLACIQTHGVLSVLLSMLQLFEPIFNMSLMLIPSEWHFLQILHWLI